LVQLLIFLEKLITTCQSSGDMVGQFKQSPVISECMYTHTHTHTYTYSLCELIKYSKNSNL